MNMSIGYAITTVVSFLLAAGYLFAAKQKNNWLVLLFLSVFIVNLGYLALACSSTLEAALMANRIAYLGSVFLPFSMLMAIANVCRIKVSRRLTTLLAGISVAVFLLAATPGYLDCYYRDVSIVFINGMARLNKIYGPLHGVYYVYLFSYFTMIAAVVVWSIRKGAVASGQYGAVLLIVVLLNISIWLIEQMIESQFEFLAVSYMISELLLLFVYDVMKNDKRFVVADIQEVQVSEIDVSEREVPEIKASEIKTFVIDISEAEMFESEEISKPVSESEPELDMMQIVALYWPEFEQLSAREREVLQCILEDKKRKDIAEALCISENTVKTHISRLYSKLGVANRRELLFQIVHRQQEHSI